MTQRHSQISQLFQGIRFNVQGSHFSDSLGKKFYREWVVHPGAVTILPKLERDQIILIRNHRFAVNEALWELPAGTLEPSEPPQKTAERELLEETGYRAQKIRPLFNFYTTPGFCDEIMRVFLAENLIFEGQKLDEGEQISVESLSFKQALKMIHSGDIRDGKTIAALLYYNSFERGEIG